jgi:diacylglycerol kinase family enzyme
MAQARSVDIAVLVNLKARRGSERVARACRTALPGARVLASRSLDEARHFARQLSDSPADLIVSAGGDGTAVALLNSIDALSSTVGGARATSVLAAIPLGTGNGWARVTGAPGWRTAVDRLGQLARDEEKLPLRRFDLVEVEGTLAPFAGTGWDAEIIDDFHAQKHGFGFLPRRARNGLAGYLQGLTTRTIPRHVVRRRVVEVELTNTGEDAMTVDESGRPVPIPGGGHGAVLYRGPMNVCAAGTSPEWGFSFRAFPFAGLLPRRFCMRIYAGHALEATWRMRSLWHGVHPMPKMHTWLLTRCRAVFSHPVPFQIGGDRLGHRSVIDYALAPQQVDLLNWHRLAI